MTLTRICFTASMPIVLWLAGCSGIPVRSAFVIFFSIGTST
jgi:hypothetical protein